MKKLILNIACILLVSTVVSSAYAYNVSKQLVFKATNETDCNVDVDLVKNGDTYILHAVGKAASSKTFDLSSWVECSTDDCWINAAIKFVIASRCLFNYGVYPKGAIIGIAEFGYHQEEFEGSGGGLGLRPLNPISPYIDGLTVVRSKEAVNQVDIVWRDVK